MKLKAIKKIKNYKSFQDFSWTSFFNSQEFHETANIFYGENGAGKSSICNILKSVCGKKSFINNQIPDEIYLKFDDGEYKFPNGSNTWNKNKGANDFLFFDREFVHDNIHLGNTRDTQANGQEQKSGKMIIEFDSEAIKLRESRQKMKQAKTDKNEERKKYKKDNKGILDFSLFENEKNLFKTYKDKTKEEIIGIKKELTKEKKEIEKKIEKQKQKEVKEKELANIKKEFDELKIKHDKAKEEYEKYCSEDVFEKTLKKIEEYFDKFKFSFKLELKKEKTGNKTELPFAFKVLDNEGNERDF